MPFPGADVSMQDAGEGIPALLPGLPRQHDGVGQVLPGRRLDDAADVQHHHDLLPLRVKHLAHVGERLPLSRRQAEVVLELAVPALPRLAGKGEHRRRCKSRALGNLAELHLGMFAKQTFGILDAVVGDELTEVATIGCVDIP